MSTTVLRSGRTARKVDGLQHGWFQRLVEVMASMAAGEPASIGEMYTEFGDPIRAQIRKEAGRLGVRLDADDVDGLAVDVCAELYERAGSWDPSYGAAPWTWARRRVRAIVCEWVGMFTDPLPEGGVGDEATLAGGASSDGHEDEDVLLTFERLAALRPDVDLLREAFTQVGRPAQQAILFEVRMQARQGDPSPAVTVGRDKGMKPDAVRQTCKRLCDKVRDLADTDPYFAPLAELPFLRPAAA